MVDSRTLIILSLSDVTTAPGGSYTTFRTGMSKTGCETRRRPLAAPKEAEHPRAVTAKAPMEGDPAGTELANASGCQAVQVLGLPGRTQIPPARSYLHRRPPSDTIAPTRTALNGSGCYTRHGDTDSPQPVRRLRTARTGRIHMFPARSGLGCTSSRGKSRPESTPAMVPMASLTYPAWRATA